jgi:hypothetical protein
MGQLCPGVSVTPGTSTLARLCSRLVSGKGVRSQHLLWTEHDCPLILQAERFGISIWVIGMLRVMRVMMDRMRGKHRQVRAFIRWA